MNSISTAEEKEKEKEVSKDNWEFIIKNDKDLEKVFEVYDKFLTP